MRFVKGSGVPAVVVAVDGAVFVGHEEVAEDFGVGGVGGDDLRLAVEGASGLIEVDGSGDVWGDGGRFVEGFADGVDLDGEGYGNAHLVEIPGEGDGFGGAPTVAVDDNGGLLFFEGGEDAVVVGVEELEDVVQSCLPVVIAEDFGVDGGVTVAEVSGELDFGVLGVVTADEPADKANDDDVAGGWSERRRSLRGERLPDCVRWLA
jgi:hypothetical protein